MAARAEYIYTPARLEELMDILDDVAPRQAAIRRRRWRDEDEAAGVAVEQEERSEQYHAEIAAADPTPPRDSWWRRWVSGP